MTTTVIILAAVLVGYFLFMKLYYPKFKQKFEAASGEADKEWAGKQSEILAEYFANPDKFGLITDALGGDRVLGMLSTLAPVRVAALQSPREARRRRHPHPQGRYVALLFRSLGTGPAAARLRRREVLSARGVRLRLRQRSDADRPLVRLRL